MAGNAYPHIVFAKSSETLPQQALADILVGLFPEAQVEQGEIKAELTLEDYTYTFWYDDDADGLGDRYAEFAAPLRRKRVTRCTTMIDASGQEDPTGVRERDVARIMAALSERDGVYVFSEQTKRFVGMEYEDSPGVVHNTEPEADLRSDASYPAHAETGAREVALGSEETSGDFPHTEERPVDRPMHEHAPAASHDGRDAPDTHDEARPEVVVPTSTAAAADPATSPPLLAVPVEGAEESRETGGATSARTTDDREMTPVDRPVDRPTEQATPQPDRPAAEHRPSAEPRPEPVAPAPAADGRPVEPARPEDARPSESRPEEDKPGLFKRLFGRKR